VVSSGYDTVGDRVGRRTSLGHEASYDFDGNGDLLGVSFGAGALWGAFGARDLAPGSSARAPWRAMFARDPAGNEIERALPGGLVSRWDRAALTGQPRVQRVEHNGAAVGALGYQWRSAEQVAAQIDTVAGVTRFAHDERGFLVSARRPDESVQHRAVDAVGNVFRSPAREDRRYEKGGRLVVAGEVLYAYDPDGQLVEKVLADTRSWKYRWDLAGQLVEVTRPDGERVSFGYDPLRRRVRKTFAGKTTRYVWDGDELVHEIRGGEDAVTWVFEPGTFVPLAKEEGGQRYGVVTDLTGAPRMIADEAGALAWKAQIDLYGVARTEVARTGCPWRWPGQYEDEETGLYYNGFRYYDPETGTYISQDPIGLEGGLAAYAYVPDPLRWIDPLGLNCGRRGERIARNYLEKRGYKILGSVQNRSGHGLDIVVRNARGIVRVVEVKTTQGLVAPALSKAQARGAGYFGDSRLQQAVLGKGPWGATHDPNMAAKANAILNELSGRFPKGFVMRVTLGDGGISFGRW